jgi:hypothetical protein
MTTLPHKVVLDVLNRLGFVPDADAMVLGDVAARLDAGWLTLRVPSAFSAAGAAAWFEKPGAWKEARTSQGVATLVELPAALLRATIPDDDEAAGVLQAMVEWTLATRPGGTPSGWTAPELETVKPLLPSGALTLQAGRHARQGELILTSARLALRIPVLLEVPPELPAERLAWLRELVIAAQSRRRLARLGFGRGRGVTPLFAEVDFTGAPEAALPALFLAGIDALRGVVSWLLPGADLCADVTVASRAFQVCVPEPATNERTDP